MSDDAKMILVFGGWAVFMALSLRLFGAIETMTQEQIAAALIIGWLVVVAIGFLWTMGKLK